MEMPESIDSRFRFVLLAARRAEQLMRGARPRVEGGSTKPTQVAMSEILSNRIRWELKQQAGAPASLIEQDIHSFGSDI